MSDILRDGRVSSTTFHRKRPIAELQILDPAKFEEVLSRCLMGENNTRLCQDFLGKNCQIALDKADMKVKRRAAIAAGKLI